MNHEAEGAFRALQGMSAAELVSLRAALTFKKWTIAFIILVFVAVMVWQSYAAYHSGRAIWFYPILACITVPTSIFMGSLLSFLIVGPVLRIYFLVVRHRSRPRFWGADASYRHVSLWSIVGGVVLGICSIFYNPPR